MTGKPEELVKWLFCQDREKLFEVKELTRHRTLSQNAYIWKLINEMANKLGKTKDEIYLQMLKDYGQSEIVSMKSNINPEGYFKYYEEIGTGKVNGVEFKHFRIYKGSSEFDTLEMKYLIDGVIQECENIGIPTLTYDQISEMRLL